MGTSPGQPPGFPQKAFPGGRDLTFESCPGAGNSTRTGILWKMKVKLQKKNSVDQIFTGENKKQAEFFSFFEVYVFLNGIFPGLWVNFLVLLSHIPYKKSEELPLACLYLKFSLGYGFHTYFCTKSYDYVERFVRVLVLLVIDTGCPKKLLKMRNTALLISSSNYAKAPYKRVYRRRFVFLNFLAIFLKHPV